MEMTQQTRQIHLTGDEAEAVVHQLGTATFLEDWCYMNPKAPDGKAIVWQIKGLKLREGGMYKQQDIEKNLRQLHGAYRTLFDKPQKITLTNPRRGPEEFSPEVIRRVYLISVMMGEDPDRSTIFSGYQGKIIHNFSRIFTELALHELDTIADFVDYLSAKEDLLISGKEVVVLGGEEEMLGYYLLNERSFNRLQDATHIMFDTGTWEHIQNRPEFVRKKEFDRPSYLWDGIISRAHEGSSEYELISRELARLNRFERRTISKIMMDAWIQADRDNSHPMFRRMISGRHASYCFLFLDENVARDHRRDMIGTMCFVARDTYRDNHKVIGIATEKKLRPQCSYDFCYMNVPQWNADAQAAAKRVRDEFGIFREPKMQRFQEDEYPQ
jgi:hypothetical protein